jgi:hypothetical protein
MDNIIDTASVRDMHRATWHYIDDTRVSSIAEDSVVVRMHLLELFYYN